MLVFVPLSSSGVEVFPDAVVLLCLFANFGYGYFVGNIAYAGRTRLWIFFALKEGSEPFTDRRGKQTLLYKDFNPGFSPLVINFNSANC